MGLKIKGQLGNFLSLMATRYTGAGILVLTKHAYHQLDRKFIILTCQGVFVADSVEHMQFPNIVSQLAD